STVFARINEAFRGAQAAAGLVEDHSIAAVELALRRVEAVAFASTADLGPRPASPVQMPQVSEGIHLQEALDVEMEEVDSAQEDEHTVADFFAAPAPTAAASPSPTPAPAPRRRPRRGFDMSTVRRSARLSNAPRIPAMQKAQQNLCRKLGILNNDMLPFEAALQEFIAMFNGPLPQDIIAALTAILHIEDGDDTLD
ncbi:hypothetical protein PVAP13_8NG065502, partial [Panicum virgatum]